MLKTGRGDCRNGEGGGGQEDIEEVGSQLAVRAGRNELRARASELTEQTRRPSYRHGPLLHGERHIRIVRGRMGGK